MMFTQRKFRFLLCLYRQFQTHSIRVFKLMEISDGQNY